MKRPAAPSEGGAVFVHWRPNVSSDFHGPKSWNIELFKSHRWVKVSSKYSRSNRLNKILKEKCWRKGRKRESCVHVGDTKRRCNVVIFVDTLWWRGLRSKIGRSPGDRRRTTTRRLFADSAPATRPESGASAEQIAGRRWNIFIDLKKKFNEIVGMFPLIGQWMKTRIEWTIGWQRKLFQAAMSLPGTDRWNDWKRLIGPSLTRRHYFSCQRDAMDLNSFILRSALPLPLTEE